MENGKNIYVKKSYKRMTIGDNSGFTLVELLIAMIILVVALIPMLNSFAVNAKVNRKSKIKLRSTMIAQDIMEGIKGYSTKDIYKQFTGVSDFRLIENDGIVDPSTHKVVSANATVSANADGLVAVYTMKDLEYQGQKYDAKLEIDGTNFTASGNRMSATVSGSKIQPNSEDLVDMSIMDSSYDGIFMSDNYYSREEFLDKLIDLNGWIGPEVNRTFEIELVDAGLTAMGNAKQLATVKVTYDTVSAGAVTLPYSRNYTAYNNVDVADDGCELRSLYFFYYPAYSGIYLVGGSNQNITYHDKIIFRNADKIPTTLYIMKQKTTDPVILPELYAREELYRPDITIIEDGYEMMGLTTKVRTNLTRSLYNGQPFSTEKATFHRGYGDAGGIPASMIEADKVLSTEKVNRMFDAVVKVYEPGAAAAGFPEDMVLTTLDSTKINQ